MTFTEFLQTKNINPMIRTNESLITILEECWNTAITTEKNTLVISSLWGYQEALNMMKEVIITTNKSIEEKIKEYEK